MFNKTTIIGAVVAVAAVAAARRFGPRLAGRAMAKCHEMMGAQTTRRGSTPVCACDGAGASCAQAA